MVIGLYRLYILVIYYTGCSQKKGKKEIKKKERNKRKDTWKGEDFILEVGMPHWKPVYSFLNI